jgi:hypothetical protein
MLTRDSMKHVRITDAPDLGTVQEGLTAIEKSSGCFHVTQITIPADTEIIEATAAADLASGLKLYELPAGRNIITHAYFAVEFDGDTAIKDDTPDVGMGMKQASGAEDTLDADSDFENIITGQTASGGIEKGVDSMTVSKSAAVVVETDDTDRVVYLNIADGWADAGKVYVEGTVIIHWTAL